jgi:DNA replication protein DnaC
VLGDEVIIAARLMEQAQPGQILVSQRVAQATINQFEFDYHGSISLKGKAERIHVFVALGQRQTTLPQWVAHFAVPPLGREQELDQLEQLLETTATGHGQLARLEGAAGIGKSHLAATLVQRAPHHKVRPVTGICQSADQHLPFIPWREHSVITKSS